METLKDKAIDMKGIEDTLDKVYTEKDLKQAIKELKEIIKDNDYITPNWTIKQINKIFGDFEEKKQ